MKKIILVGRSEAGKTTLTQALKGENIRYEKTQYVNRFDVIIDTPGEYIQAKELGSDYIVVGRPITQAEDPVAAYRRCMQEFVGA